jgi:cytidine deaminase
MDTPSNSWARRIVPLSTKSMRRCWQDFARLKTCGVCRRTLNEFLSLNNAVKKVDEKDVHWECVKDRQNV